MRKIFLGRGQRSLTFLFAGESPATLAERAALQLALPRPACDFRTAPYPYGPRRPAGGGQ